MIISNNYYYFTKALDNDICDKILELGKEKLKTSGIMAGTFDKRGIDEENSNPEFQGDKTQQEVSDNAMVRDSKICWLGDNDNEKWLYELLQPYLHTANQESGWKFHWDWSDSIQFTEYGLNQFYGWHYDGGSDHNCVFKDGPEGGRGKVRKLSMTVNLSKPEDYDGGNLKFDWGPHQKESQGPRFKECTEIRPRGSIIVFPSFMYHQVTPVTRGVRYSLVMQNRGNPFV